MTEPVIDLDKYYSDTSRLDAVGRMGDDGYATTRNLVDQARIADAQVLATALATQGGGKD